MDDKKLTEILANNTTLRRHAEYLRSISKPRIDISLIKDSPLEACSRFSGIPFVPRDFVWPVHNSGEYRFLGQINFSEIVQPPLILPRNGLLSLFYAYDEEGNCFWGDDGYIKGFYWNDISNHKMASSPTSSPTKTRRVKLSTGIDIPRHFELRNDWPFDEDALSEISDEIDSSGEYLLGYPSFNSLAYDPTPGSDWMSLLTIGSLDEFEWCWHDGDKLMIFIQEKMLINADFSSLKSDAG